MVKGISLLAVAGALLSGVSAQAPSATEPKVDLPDFDPEVYQKQKKYVTCKAQERSAVNGTAPQDIKIKLAYLDINPDAKKTLILVHGWPSLWTTYRHQIVGLPKDYRLILPENRGYGDSEHPKDLQNSNSFYDFVGDLTCILDNAGVDQSVCVGNDFGAQVCWAAGRGRPDRFIGVFNVGIPYVSSATDFTPNAALAALNPYFSYQVYLGNDPAGAAKEMNADIRTSIRSAARPAGVEVPPTFLKQTTNFLQPWKDFLKAKNLTEIPWNGIMSHKVEDYMVKSYQKQGFYNTYNGYQYGNRHQTWEKEHTEGNFTLSQPTYNLFPTKDIVADWAAFAVQVKAAAFLKNFKNSTVESAHWPQEEKPAEFNKALLNWLESDIKFPAGPSRPAQPGAPATPATPGAPASSWWQRIWTEFRGLNTRFFG